DHKMHRELVIATKDDVTNLAHNKRSVTAVGTTSVRSLESLYFLALHVMDNPDINPDDLKVEQWEAYIGREYFPSRMEAFEALLSYMDRNNLEEILFPTEILIAPGYTYRVVEAMVTNFHQPQSTLILLVAAFIGDNWRKVYDHALKADYRFLSYGDSSLLIP
ncbi:MAG: S-adenosylmethionine:tRNA ribosyltransferase-isomerase, partial [Porphyromonadaceae bacterium]|nr:S-adenosylmethionine:tRNA ribosyltransferase-isomerase [Porphyromonadaceae bacterium]